ncbi:hypothetical protein FA15DRAFT_742903 [Coprinopsis marcescibilis]|uniref:CBM1 domain-containing protein n=1 Tax=Coprinopsis marcescibilis TaxID=230819 RepID=A0A5C3KUP6_COPMA|nr:hypothetical protein FA15DRAFT_742903 [Coprinopsis marcescibilis]
MKLWSLVMLISALSSAYALVVPESGTTSTPNAPPTSTATSSSEIPTPTLPDLIPCGGDKPKCFYWPPSQNQQSRLHAYFKLLSGPTGMQCCMTWGPPYTACAWIPYPARREERVEG